MERLDNVRAAAVEFKFEVLAHDTQLPVQSWPPLVRLVLGFYEDRHCCGGDVHC